MVTKHTHPVIFGRKVAGCPRCAELLAGAPVVQWRPSHAQEDARRCAEVRAHFDKELRAYIAGCHAAREYDAYFEAACIEWNSRYV